MQSLSRVIKATEIAGKEIIIPPAIERVSEKVKQITDSEESSISIYETIVQNAGVEAEKILKDAGLNAEAILGKAYSEANDIKLKAKEEGYQEGYKIGYTAGYEYGIGEANKEANEIIDKAEFFLSSSHEEVKRYIVNSEKEIINIAVSIAKKIINSELSINEEAIISMAENVLSKTIDKKQVVLKVNPDEYNFVKNKKNQLSIYVENENDLFIVADPYISKGCFKAETPSGFINGDINTQLELIIKNLIEE
jgi:flagellar assembly protein FliH